MNQTNLIMGMPITVEIRDPGVSEDLFEKVFSYFMRIDEIFSTYKETSEISRLNRAELKIDQCSPEVQEIFALAEQTKRETKGYFNCVRPDGVYDPSGIVKGWAIYQASMILMHEGCSNFFIEAGGDIQVYNKGSSGDVWKAGIRNPFHKDEIIKVVALTSEGLATSGTAVRGQHIYNPHNPNNAITDTVSLSVIAKNIYEADRLATAAFAMGKDGIVFLENLFGVEGYQINNQGIATSTSGFARYVV